MSQLCSIHNDIPVTLHILGAYVQWSECLTTMVASSRWSSGQDMGFGGLRMANSKSGDYNLLSSGKVLEFLRGPQCWFHEIEISALYSYIPLGLNQLLNIGVDQWFQIYMMDTCQWV